MKGSCHACIQHIQIRKLCLAKQLHQRSTCLLVCARACGTAKSTLASKFQTFRASDMEKDRDSLLIASPSKSLRKWMTVGKKAVFRLLLVIMLERSSFYCIISSSSLYCKSYLHFPSLATTLMAVPLIGSVYIFAPVFGWLSDRKFGYFPVLCSAFALYVVGMIPICYTAARTTQQYDDNELSLLQGLYVVGVVVIVLSASAVRATLLPYMLEQLGDGSESHTVIVGLITASYFAVNLGAILAAVVGGYLWKQASLYNKSEYTGIFWTYISASLCLFLSFLLLVLWRKQYRSHAAEGRAEYSPSLRDIFLTGCGCYRAQPGPMYYDAKELPIKNKEEEEKDRLDEHRQRLGVLVPVLSTLVIFYTVQRQLWNGFADQLLHMDFGYEEQEKTNLSINKFSNYCTINSTNNHYLLPPPALAGLSAVSVLLMIPVVWWFIRSMYVRWRHHELTMLDRVLVGMVLTLLGCIAVTGVEVARILCGHFHVICLKMNQDPLVIVYSTVSPFIQIPQQLLVGLGEAFIGIAAREFVLSRAPHEFRCTAYGSIYFINGLGNFAGALLLIIMQKLHCYYREITLAHTVTITSLIATEKSLTTWANFVVLTALMIVGCFSFYAVKRRHRDVLRLARARIGRRTR